MTFTSFLSTKVGIPEPCQQLETLLGLLDWDGRAPPRFIGGEGTGMVGRGQAWWGVDRHGGKGQGWWEGAGLVGRGRAGEGRGWWKGAGLLEGLGWCVKHYSEF